MKLKPVVKSLRLKAKEGKMIHLDKESECVRFLQRYPDRFRREFPILFSAIGKYALVDIQRGIDIELSQEEIQEMHLADSKYLSESKSRIKVKLKPKKSVPNKWWSEAQKFQGYTKKSYEIEGIPNIEPMLAKEYLNEAMLDEMCSSSRYYAEEKLDGVRCTAHFRSEGVRTFSRNLIKKTGWRKEFSDSLPHIRDMILPELNGTIIDGELIIPNQEFKEVSSTLNCIYDKAIERQKKLGYICLFAFDIIAYKGEDVTQLPLIERKRLLEDVVKIVLNKYGNLGIRLVPYFDNTIKATLPKYILDMYFNKDISKESYPNMVALLDSCLDLKNGDELLETSLNKKQFYEYVVLTGGEGIILKDKTETYKFKRGREYTKWKKFLTRDCIIIGFSNPTKLYEGKALEEDSIWHYWIKKSEINEDNAKAIIKDMTVSQATSKGLVAVTKAYAMKWVGNLKIGIIVTSEDIKEIEKTKNGREAIKEGLWKIQNQTVLCVGECTGMTEEDRIMFTENRLKYRYTVVEILGNELFTDTGKMRHPRFIRLREDKNFEECTWENHIGGRY